MSRPARDLSGLTLPPARTAPAPPPPVDVEVDAAPTDTAEAPAPAAPRTPKKTKAKTGTETGPKKPVIIYPSAETKAALEREAAAAGVSFTDWVLDAFDARYETLGELFGPAPKRQSPLPARSRAGAQPAGHGTTTLQMRMTAAEIAVIDERRTALLGDGSSRSAFLVRVIEAQLASTHTP